MQLFPATIKSVSTNSPAALAGVVSGDALLSVNGVAIPDILAYRRELERGEARLVLRRENGTEFGFGVSWEDPGLEFEEVLFDGIKLCANKCEFCYVHQMPRGFRKSLYIMDDDYRLSFLYGSFVTLTNLTEDDFSRILNENLSPLYVSVHSTNQDLRSAMMKWWKLKVKDEASTKIQETLERLAPIDLYTQLVLMPGRNDGDYFEESLAHLASLPNVLAVACVPVGLTDHRKNLPELRAYTRMEARSVLEIVRRWQKKMLATRGTRFVFASDEFYILSGEPIPEAETYEGFAMLENGVGMVRDFLGDNSFLENNHQKDFGNLPNAVAPTRVILGTGSLFAPILQRAIEPLRKIAGLNLEVRVIANKTFGDVTSVAGLLTGRCFLDSIQAGEADLLLVSPNTLRYGTETMLDEITLSDLRTQLKMDVRAGGRNLQELILAILGNLNSGQTQFGLSTQAIKEQH